MSGLIFRCDVPDRYPLRLKDQCGLFFVEKQGISAFEEHRPYCDRFFGLMHELKRGGIFAFCICAVPRRGGRQSRLMTPATSTMRLGSKAFANLLIAGADVPRGETL